MQNAKTLYANSACIRCCRRRVRLACRRGAVWRGSPSLVTASPFVKMTAWNARGTYLHTQNPSKKEKTPKSFVVLSEKSVIAPVKRAVVCLRSCLLSRLLCGDAGYGGGVSAFAGDGV